MKKLFTLVVVVLMVVGAKAQTEIVVGPKVGLNMTNISNFDLKNKLSFHVGGFAEFRFNDYFAIQPELVYSRPVSYTHLDDFSVRRQNADVRDYARPVGIYSALEQSEFRIFNICIQTDIVSVSYTHLFHHK